MAEKNRKSGKKGSKKRSPREKQIMTYRVGGSILILVVLLVVIISVVRYVTTRPRKENVQDGVQYLAELEARDTASTMEKINEIKKKERRQALESGDVSVWSMFYDYMILGDSRAVGFSFYNFLEEDRVLAEGGNTIAVVPDRLDQVRAMNPGNIFLCYGINDVSIGIYPTPEFYAEEMDKTVQLLQETCPNAQIYVNSIFPAQDPAFEEAEEWRNIPDYNVAVKAMCEEKGYHYIDNDPVYEEHKDLYGPDGIHFDTAMYDYWAINMIAEMDAQEA